MKTDGHIAKESKEKRVLHRIALCVGLLVWFCLFSAAEMLIANVANPAWYGLSPSKSIPYAASAGFAGMFWAGIFLGRSTTKASRTARLLLLVLSIVGTDIIVFSCSISVFALFAQGNMRAPAIVLGVTFPYLVLYHGWHKIVSVSAAVFALRVLPLPTQQATPRSSEEPNGEEPSL